MPRIIPLILLLTLLLPAAPARGADDNESLSALRLLVENRTKELSIIEEQVAQRTEQFDEDINELRKLQDDYRATYHEIAIVHGLSGTTPVEAKETFRRLSTLYANIQRLRQEVGDLLDQSKARLDRVTPPDLDADKNVLTELSPEMRQRIDEFTRRLTPLRRGIERQRTALERLKKDVDKQLETVGSLLKERQQALPEMWRNYLLGQKPSVVSPDFWDRFGQFPTWGLRTLTGWQYQWRLYRASIWGILGTLVVFWGGFMLLGTALLRKLIRLHEVFADSLPFLRFRWSLVSLGSALYMTDFAFFPETMGAASVIAGTIGGLGALPLANEVRGKLAQVPRLAMTPLVLLYFMGSLLLTTDAPDHVAVTGWMLTVLLFLSVMYRRLKAFESGSGKSRFTFLWYWMSWLLLIIAATGYGRVSALVGVCWFQFYTAYTLGVAIIRLVRERVNMLPDTGFYPILQGFILGLVSPLVLTLSFLAAFFWLYHYMGGSFVLNLVAGWELSWEGFSLKLLSVLTVAVLFYLTRSGVAMFRGTIERYGARWPRGKRGAVPSLQTIVSYALWAVFALAALKLFGFGLSNLAVIAGGLSVGIGFGLQNIFNNFFSGLILLFGGSLQQGDVLQIDGLWCTVLKINIRTTVIETFESATILIPNSDLVTGRVTNWTKNNAHARRDIMVGVAYGSDTEKVRQTLLEVAKQHRNVMGLPAPQVLFHEFGASSLDFILRVWVDDLDYMLRTCSDLRFAVDAAFRKADIEIAFPQMDLHIRSAEGLRRQEREEDTPLIEPETDTTPKRGEAPPPPDNQRPPSAIDPDDPDAPLPEGEEEPEADETDADASDRS